MSSILSGIDKETVAFIVGGCFLIGISTQFDDPYRIISFTIGLIMIPLSFVWSSMENRWKRKERLELQKAARKQLERMKVKCPKCSQMIIPRKVGKTFFCPSCSHQFESTRQIMEDWEKGIETAHKFIDLLKSLEE